MIRLSFEDPCSAVASVLIEALSAEIRARYPGNDGSGNFNPQEALAPGAAFVIAWKEQVAVGCGALRPSEPGVAEIKRMYVVPEYRGQRIGGLLLEKLEEKARVLGYRSVKLETGWKQPESIRLYERCGYHRIPCYPPYEDQDESVCYAKDLY
jgi:putative acetyltransferase